MRQGHREKISVTIDPRLHEAVRRYAQRAAVSKSQVIEEAVRVWESALLARAAREGYETMAQEDLTEAEAYMATLLDLVDLEGQR